MSTLIRYQPLSGSLDALLNDIFRPVWDTKGAADTLPARIDVRENDEAYVVQAELPGVKKDDIHVEIDGNEVGISAEVRREKEAREGEKWLRVERRYGKTERRFALPQDVDDARAQAKFADGVLELTLPKKVPAAGRKLQIS